jgi:hypothetical protein
MSKVISTKLTREEAGQFSIVAEQQGHSKASLLKQLVQEYLNGDDKNNVSAEDLIRGGNYALSGKQSRSIARMAYPDNDLNLVNDSSARAPISRELSGGKGGSQYKSEVVTASKMGFWGYVFIGFFALGVSLDLKEKAQTKAGYI